MSNKITFLAKILNPLIIMLILIKRKFTYMVLH